MNISKILNSFSFIVLLNIACAQDISLSVSVKNNLDIIRLNETVSIKISDIKNHLPNINPSNINIVDEKGNEILSQLVDIDGDKQYDEIVFQADLNPQEKKSFLIKDAKRRYYTREDFKAYGRFVRERFDDFAWENDRVAFRTYGKALETTPGEMLISSGIDIWFKRVRKLIINDWYMMDNYHKDFGEGADMYSVHTTRGCGGIGIVVNDSLITSRNFVDSKVLANGPIRLIFELTYLPWNANESVAEKKRVILDAGSNFNKFESYFDSENKNLQVGIGIAVHQGSESNFDKKSGIMTTWEPIKNDTSGVGCAVIINPKNVIDKKILSKNYTLVANTEGKIPFVYYVGYAWNKSGTISNYDEWKSFVADYAKKIESPIEVTLIKK